MQHSRFDGTRFGTSIRRPRLLGASLAALVLAVVGLGHGAAFAEDTAEAEDDACEMLFVQTAAGFSSDGKQLTLKSPSPDLLFFCDRPERMAGHLTWDAFLGLVTEGENDFAENPPNAAVSVIGDGGEVTEVVVTLTEHPTKKGADISFPMKVIDGTLPKHGGTTILFIDPIGRPMSPTSVAGVHRRHRRRAILRH